MLERDGLQGLTLRAVAREAGVSHAAPTHHFGDLTGLISELAAIGFRQFNAAMAAAPSMAGGASPKARVMAYVTFAQAHPGLYGLMFRTERLDMTRPALCDAANASFAGLAGAIGASRHEHISAAALTLEQGAAIARAWSLVHGFTMLLLDGRLSDILRRMPEGTSVETLLGAMLVAQLDRDPDQRRSASSTARPRSPATFTASLAHWKSQAPAAAALRLSALASGLACISASATWRRVEGAEPGQNQSSGTGAMAWATAIWGRFKPNAGRD